MYRNYQRGRHETLNVDLTDVGSDQFMVRADGLEGNAFYDMAIYSDSGRTTPLSVSDWEYYTEDERKTAQETETGGTGETVYSQIKILNPTYQSGAIYLTFESFGTYPDGNVQGIDYLEPGDADYAFTTQRNLMTYIVFDGLTADRTVTVTDGGFDERSRFKIVNNDSTYKVIVEDGTEGLPHWVIAGQSTEFYDMADTLKWSSAGRELLYRDTSNTGTVAWGTQNLPSSLTSSLIGNYYEIGGSNSGNIDVWYTGVLKIRYTTDYQYTPVLLSTSRYRVNASGFSNEESSVDVHEIYQIHEAH